MPDSPQIAADADLDLLVRRLRGLSRRAWSPRREPVRRLVADLVALGPPGHPVPDLPDHALGDVVAVLSQEALLFQGAQRHGRRDEVAAAVARALVETR